MNPAPVPHPTPLGLRDLLLLGLLPLVLLLIHFALGSRYGFHRDELQFLSDARHLAPGFVAYPPLTPLVGRAAIALFGISPAVFRLPAALINAGTLVLAGLTARELGGRRAAMLLASLALLPVTLAFSSVLQYNTPDLFAWTLLLWASARVLSSGNPRFWLVAGLAVGLGALSKYSIAFAVVSLLAAVALLPRQRHHLRSRWFCVGALLALLIAAPNLLWLARHGWVTLRMEQWIHARDIRLGRTAGYWTDQLRYTLLALPLALLGLVTLLRSDRFRLLSAFFVGPLLLFALAQGRGYYLLPAYTPLYVAAAVRIERWVRRPAMPRSRRWLYALTAGALLLDSVAIAALYLPAFPANSAAWRWQMRNNGDLRDEIGWPELAAEVAAVRDRLPTADWAHLAVLVENYGEAGALELYGPAHRLPPPISTVNSFFFRGYGAVPPETVLVLGSNLHDQLRNFETCTVAGRVTNVYGIGNEETLDHPEILLCHHLRQPWPQAWSHSEHFG